MGITGKEDLEALMAKRRPVLFKYRGKLTVTPQFLLSMLTEHGKVADSKGGEVSTAAIVGVMWDHDRQLVNIYLTGLSQQEVHFEGAHPDPATIIPDDPS